VKQKWTILLMLLLAWLFFAVPATAEDGAPFRVVGYYSATSFDEPLEQVQMDCYTHLMYGFFKPQADGSVLPTPKPELLQQLVAQAHDSNVQVFAAVGGWSYQDQPLAPTFAAMASDSKSRTRFVHAMLDIVQTYNLDGVELDWEYPKTETAEAYAALVLELADALHAQGKALSAAVAGATAADESAATSKMILPEALEALDFVEIMAYDLHTTEHSPLWFARTSVSYWQKQLPADKIVLGMPLYARPSWVQYRHLVAADPENAYRNFVAAGTVSKLDSSYNGLPLLHDKTVYALDQTGGIMFFDINEDAAGTFSAVRMAADLVRERAQIGQAAFAKQVWVYLDNHPLEFATADAMGQPFIDDNGRTQLPLRRIAEAIGATVEYDSASRTVTLQKEQQTVQLQIGSRESVIHGTAQTLDCAPLIRDGRTYLPARVVFESFGYQVQWNKDGRSVSLNQTA